MRAPLGKTSDCKCNRTPNAPVDVTSSDHAFHPFGSTVQSDAGVAGPTTTGSSNARPKPILKRCLASITSCRFNSAIRASGKDASDLLCRTGICEGAAENCVSEKEMVSRLVRTTAGTERIGCESVESCPAFSGASGVTMARNSADALLPIRFPDLWYVVLPRGFGVVVCIMLHLLFMNLMPRAIWIQFAQ